MTQHFKSLLDGNPELFLLASKTKALLALQRHFMGVAPPHLAQFSQVLSLKQGVLSIAVASATDAAKLRQLAPELAAMMRNRGCEVSGISVKVQVAVSYIPPRPPPRKLGKPAQDALSELSMSLGDSPLKLALKKLSEKN